MPGTKFGYSIDSQVDAYLRFNGLSDFDFSLECDELADDIITHPAQAGDLVQAFSKKAVDELRQHLHPGSQNFGFEQLAEILWKLVNREMEDFQG